MARTEIPTNRVRPNSTNRLSVVSKHNFYKQGTHLFSRMYIELSRKHYATYAHRQALSHHISGKRHYVIGSLNRRLSNPVFPWQFDLTDRSRSRSCYNIFFAVLDAAEQNAVITSGTCHINFPGNTGCASNSPHASPQTTLRIEEAYLHDRPRQTAEGITFSDLAR